jgi:hypothetical protein
MSRFRFTIASLMAIIIPVALGLAALHEATQFWVDVVFNVVVVFLLLATCKAKFSQGIARAYWTGFAAFGWTQLVLGMIELGWGQAFGVSPHLATLMIVEQAWEFLSPTASIPPSGLGELRARVLVIQSLLSLLLGLIGAMVFGFIASRREPVVVEHAG